MTGTVRGMIRQTVAWDGPAPIPGDYLAGRKQSELWQILGIARLRGGGRISLDLKPISPAALPENAMVHGWLRMKPHDEDGPARVRQVTGTGPTGVMKSHWRDPDDMTPNASRRPREISGYRTYDPLRRLAAHKGSQFEHRHVLAADMLRGQVDIAVIGRGGRRMDEMLRQGFGPVSGPSGVAIEGVWARENAQRALMRLGPSTRLLVTAIVLMNCSVHAWCAETKPPRDAKLETGRLLAALDLLADHYAAEIDDAVSRGTMEVA